MDQDAAADVTEPRSTGPVYIISLEKSYAGAVILSSDDSSVIAGLKRSYDGRLEIVRRRKLVIGDILLLLRGVVFPVVVCREKRPVTRMQFQNRISERVGHT